MGATLSQPYIPLLPGKTKSKCKRPRYLFRLRIRWKKKRTVPEIHTPFPNPGHDHQESRESKLYDSNSTEGEEKFSVSDSHTFTSASSTRPAPTSPVAEKIFKEPSSTRVTSPSRLSPPQKSHQSLPIWFVNNEKPLPKLPNLQVVASAAQFPGDQQAQPTTSSELPPTEDIQAINASLKDTKHDASASDSYSDFPPGAERPHTPPPWDTSLSGYGSVLEVSRPFRARRIFEHPLVEGHFLGNKEDSFFTGGGPLAAEEKRRMWRVWESTKEKEKRKGKKREYNGVSDDWKKEVGLKSGRRKAIEREMERERGKAMGSERGKKRIKTQKRRMSEWRKWKALPRYPACTGVAQRGMSTSSTWAVRGDRAWREGTEEAEGQKYQGGRDGKEEEEDEDGDLEQAIKRFLEIKIPVDLSSLRRLRTSFAGTGEYITTANSGTRETAKEDSEMAMEGEQGQLSPSVESLMFTDTDIEGFEFLIEEEDEGGGIWESEIAVEVKEACKMDGSIGDFAGGDHASRAEVSEEDAGHTVKRAFSVTQRLSRWKERK